MKIIGSPTGVTNYHAPTFAAVWAQQLFHPMLSTVYNFFKRGNNVCHTTTNIIKNTTTKESCIGRNCGCRFTPQIATKCWTNSAFLQQLSFCCSRYPHLQSLVSLFKKGYCSQLYPDRHWCNNLTFRHINNTLIDSTLPPWVVGTLTVRILLFAGSGSLAVITFPVMVTGLPVIWNVWPAVAIVVPVVATVLVTNR